MFQRKRDRQENSGILQLSASFLYMILILGPFVFLIADLAVKIYTDNSGLSDLFGYSERRTVLLANSACLAVFVSVSCTFFGTLIAIAFWNSVRIRKNTFLYMLTIAMPIPAYIHAMSWMYLFNVLNDSLDHFLNINVEFSGFFPSVLVQFFSLLPISIALSFAGLNRIDMGLIEAARILREDRRTLFKVVLPLAKPMILAGSGIVFLLSIIDYSIPSLFQYNVYSLEIFAEYSSSGNSANALVLSLPLIFVTLFAFVLTQNGIKSATAGFDNRVKRRVDIFELPVWFQCLQISACCLFFLQMFIPISALVFQQGAWKALFNSFSNVTAELGLTFRIAAVASLICLFPAYGVASLLKTKGRYSGLLWIIALLPVAIPASLTGIAIAGLFNRPVLQIASESLLMPVLGSVVRFMPFSLVILLAQLHRTDPLLFDAAKLLTNSSFAVFFRIRLPLMAPGLLASVCIVFILASGELGATLLLIPPGFETLTIKIYNYMHYGASEKVAGLCLMMMITVLLCGFAAIKLMNTGRKWSP